MDGSEPVPATIDDLVAWLTREALGQPETGALFRGCCERLCAAGLPLERGHISFSTLHPLYSAMSCTWRRDGSLDTASFPHHPGPAREAWQQSPLFHMIQARLPRLRRRLMGPGARLDFPMLAELRAQGATDYVGFLRAFDLERHRGVVGSWTSAAPAGFDGAQLEALARVETHLALACKVAINDQIARNVVDAYLGPEVGRRVLGGSIQRGDGEAVRAAIWYSDLRSSTDRARELSVEAFLGLLNRYFEIAVGALRAEGGEVVALVGDAVLGLFRAPEGEASDGEICRRALAAARRARRDPAAAGAGGELEFGIGLNLGTVVYGNIGAVDRLEFTVVGSAVNEAARIEALTRSLGHPVLASGGFARALPLAWRDLGRHALRGLADGLEILAPPE